MDLTYVTADEPTELALVPPSDGPKTAKPTMEWVHAVRALAIFLVVVLHVSAEAFYLGAKIDTYDWWVANIYDSGTRICVPLFFMLTGYLLLGSADSVGLFYRKRARRILVPWLSWSLVYLLLVACYEVRHPSGTSFMTVELMNRISEAGPWALLYIGIFPMYYHLWFLYALIVIYLFLPLWRRVLRPLSARALWGVAGAWTVIAAVLAFTANIQKPPLVMIPLVAYYLVAGLLGFPLLGHLLGRAPLTRRLFAGMVALAVVGTLVTIAGTYVMTRRDAGVLNVTFWGDVPNIVGSAAAVFVVVRYLVEKRSAGGRHLPRAVTALSETSFGVYLFHPILLYALSVGWPGFKATALTYNSVLAIPVLSMATVAVSHFVVRGLQKIPYVRAMVG
jgi:surface polysaccharide O-acyltransferase-like enzyme